MFTYLPQNASSTLAAFKYKGEDRSYIYAYFWQPLCRYVVEFLPRWLAPNVITVFALVIVSVVHCLVAWYMPQLKVNNASSALNQWEQNKINDFLIINGSNSSSNSSINRNQIIFSNRSNNYTPEIKLSHAESIYSPLFSYLPGPPPRSLFVLCALAIFSYQLLDNLDGHQARRLLFSSPLGLLMDHGCDAVNCIISSLTFAASLNAGSSWKTWVIVINILTVFFMNTWEEYYIDALILPVVNGPNEGLLIGMALYLWTAYVGGPYWWSEHGVELPIKELKSIVPSSWLTLLSMSPPVAAVHVEKWILNHVCPLTSQSSYLNSSVHERYLLNSSSFTSTRAAAATSLRLIEPVSKPHWLWYAMFDLSTSIRALLLYHANCAPEYMSNPPLPNKVILRESTASSSSPASLVMVDHRYHGHSMIQNAVLKLYGRDEQFVRMRANTIVVWFLCCTSLCTCLGNMIQVYRAIRKYSNAVKCAKFGIDIKRISHLNIWDKMRLTFPFTYALTRLLPLVVLTLFANIWYFISPTQIFAAHPRLFCWTVGLLYTKMSVHLMLSHLCAEPFRPFRRTFYPFLLFAVHLSLTYVHRVQEIMKLTSRNSSNNYDNYNVSHINKENTLSLLSAQNTIIGMDEEVLLYELFMIAVISFIHLAYYATREVQSALHLPLFTVSLTKNKKREQITESAKDEVFSGKVIVTVNEVGK